MTHRCPVDRCQSRIRRAHLMCWTHWFMVPPALRFIVTRAWNHGMGEGTPEHESAKQEAIEAVNARLERRAAAIKECVRKADMAAG